MKITLEILQKIEPNITANIRANANFKGCPIERLVGYLNTYALEFDITTPLRWAHYLSQIMHESGGFRYSEEIASGRAYEGRKDLGNTQKDDGVKYKGRGLIQLTGRANYTKYKAYCGFDVVSQPELLARPIGAVRSSMWFWSQRSLNYYADRDRLLDITKRINGGTNGFKQRETYLKRAKAALGIN